MAKSWQEKYEDDRPKQIKVLDRDFADMKKGETMLISTPRDIADYINHLPADKNIDLATMRKDLAKKYKVDKTCPVTTGIFTRIIAERSLELMADNKPPIAPFWKVISPTSPLAHKISCGPELIEQLRSE